MSTGLTRRAALSGAVASVAMVGVAAAGAVAVASASSGDAEWNAALHRWQQASAAWLNLPLETDRETDDAFAAREGEAWGALIHMQAPNVTALHWKLHQLFGDEGAGGHWSHDIMRSIVADAARLAKMEG